MITSAGTSGCLAEGDRLVTHYFDCTLPGYRGWRWSVTVARAPRAKQVTVCETVLLPGDDALLAPVWVPWQERLQPGDLGVGDLLPTRADDDRLVPGYVLSDDPAVEEVGWELGLGRPSGDVPGGPGRGGSTLVRRRPRAGGGHLVGRAGERAVWACAASTCRWPVRYARCSGCAGTCSHPTTGAWSAPTMAAGRTRRCWWRPPTAVEELPTVYDDGDLEPVAVSRSAGSVADGEPAESYGHG